MLINLNIKKRIIKLKIKKYLKRNQKVRILFIIAKSNYKNNKQKTKYLIY